MVDLHSYVEQALRAGYSADSIKFQLQQLGYSQSDISNAFGSKKTWIWFSVIVLLIAISAVFFVLPGQKQSIFQVRVSVSNSEAAQGETIFWNAAISGNGNVKLEYELNGKSSSVMKNSEDILVKGKAEISRKLSLPKQLTPGPYVLIAQVQNSKSAANIIVRASSTCFDGIKNQGEEDTDCGGPCNECNELLQECPSSCDDTDPCTADSCERGTCLHSMIVPCCGNQICEVGETVGICAIDCIPQTIIRTSDDILEDALTLSTTNPERAAYLCTGMSLTTESDVCLTKVAKSASDSAICSQISGEQEHDSCIFYFVLERKDYIACDFLRNKYIQSSCYNMGNLNAV